MRRMGQSVQAHGGQERVIYYRCGAQGARSFPNAGCIVFRDRDLRYRGREILNEKATGSRSTPGVKLCVAARGEIMLLEKLFNMF